MTLRSLAPRVRLLAALVLLFAFSGCTNAYYSAMEQIGQHKRDILRSRIEAGQQDQQEAQEQIKSTYERFKEAADYDGGDFERVYDTLNSESEAAQDRADDVSERIESIEEVAADLFTEWQEEIALYSSASLKRSSEQSLRETKQRYAKLIAAMKRAESKMPPVLNAFRDQVLFMKHSLNARAIAALEGTVGEIESDVASLIRDIDASIREAESFLDQFEAS
ncbi:MAG: DNA repair protein [Deltaproteobacteria bacterium]|nr:DNA repair protein [Deltaproteobacteria bacterium]